MSTDRNDALRKRHRELIARGQPACYLCGHPIDFSLKWPDPMCFVVDHVVAVANGGSDALHNKKAAHHPSLQRDKERTRTANHSTIRKPRPLTAAQRGGAGHPSGVLHRSPGLWTVSPRHFFHTALRHLGGVMSRGLGAVQRLIVDELALHPAGSIVLVGDVGANGRRAAYSLERRGLVRLERRFFEGRYRLAAALASAVGESRGLNPLASDDRSAA